MKYFVLLFVLCLFGFMVVAMRIEINRSGRAISQLQNEVEIKEARNQYLELEISPLTIWSNPGSEGEFMEYQIGLYCGGESIFSEKWTDKLVALKDEENIYLSDFIAETLTERKENNWTMLEPKVSLYMHPGQTAGCCSAFNRPDPFILQVTLEQNIFAGENKVFGPYSNTGLDPYRS